MLLAIFKQMIALGRHPRTFVRVDRRNQRSLALCDRVGLTEEAPILTPTFSFSAGASYRKAPNIRPTHAFRAKENTSRPRGISGSNSGALIHT